MPLDGRTENFLPRTAMKAEMLDAETELKLAYAWRDERCEESLHRLINAYMRLAISQAAKFKRYGAPMGDSAAMQPLCVGALGQHGLR